ncbi:Mor transcription activator family protein [Halomonas saccharevitans]|uniref:Transcriptional regulator, Middle operon regulator (Mor) family n=1 Tax=Halomonas saccharevitans TaxID=416872 RepID=A0A1I7AGL9_9GAMM|nr:Mor transcription activator family protein [Halomonas saccharevitans]SFT74079.1 Transcriptional regulator, Middle operon regulator (Mor) family [Halomonas saccharevitans]
MLDVREIQELPQSLTDVAEAIGLAATLALVEHAGGVRIYVLERLGDEHRLIDWLGREAAVRLSEALAMEELVVPRCADALRRVRNRQMRLERDQGARPAELALRYRLTERQVYTILSRADDEARDQISLL